MGFCRRGRIPAAANAMACLRSMTTDDDETPAPPFSASAIYIRLGSDCLFFHDTASQKNLPTTTGNPTYAEGFAECTISSTRQNYYLLSAYEKALDKQTTLASENFAECQPRGTRQSHTLPSA